MVHAKIPSSPPAFLAPVPPRRRRFAWLFVMVSLLLLLAIAAQIAYFKRTELAIWLPQTRPWLVRTCAHLGCKVELPQKIDLMSIDDSDLQEDAERDGVVRLSATLVNHAPFAQAYPQMELTLTDLDDHAVLRRTFSPAEYLAEGTRTEAGMPAEGEVHVKLALTVAADAKAAGYRVYITYPSSHR